jgi:pyridoxal phosphate enzyme (YggS family)
MSLQERITIVRQRMNEACARVGRSSGDVQLLLATKTQSAQTLREAAACGELLFGENRVQELVSKATDLADLPITWHFIGHLQSNKVKDAARFSSCTQSMDRPSIVEALQRELEKSGRTMDVLVEVKTASEDTKHGCEPEEVESLLTLIAEQRALRVRGFMTIGSFSSDERIVRACFAQLRGISEDARSRGLAPADATTLSMGMSGDLEWAIAEGSTMIRAGTAVFGERDARV